MVPDNFQNQGEPSQVQQNGQQGGQSPHPPPPPSEQPPPGQPPYFHPQQDQSMYAPPPPPPKKDSSTIIIVVLVIIVAIVLIGVPVLYVMVIGFGGSTYEAVPVGAWNDCSATSATEGKIIFGHFSGQIEYDEIEIFVYEDGLSAGTISLLTFGNEASATWDNAPDGASADYFDHNLAGGEINSGDYITLTGLEPGTEYSFEVYHLPTDCVVTMVGDSGLFETPLS